MSTRGLHWWIRRIWVTAGTLFMVWLVYNMQAHDVSPGLLASSSRLTVTVEDTMTTFVPTPAAEPLTQSASGWQR